MGKEYGIFNSSSLGRPSTASLPNPVTEMFQGPSGDGILADRLCVFSLRKGLWQEKMGRVGCTTYAVPGVIFMSIIIFMADWAFPSVQRRIRGYPFYFKVHNGRKAFCATRPRIA